MGWVEDKVNEFLEKNKSNNNLIGMRKMITLLAPLLGINAVDVKSMLDILSQVWAELMRQDYVIRLGGSQDSDFGRFYQRRRIFHSPGMTGGKGIICGGTFIPSFVPSNWLKRNGKLYVCQVCLQMHLQEELKKKPKMVSTWRPIETVAHSDKRLESYEEQVARIEDEWAFECAYPEDEYIAHMKNEHDIDPVLPKLK